MLLRYFILLSFKGAANEVGSFETNFFRTAGLKLR